MGALGCWLSALWITNLIYVIKKLFMFGVLRWSAPMSVVSPILCLLSNSSTWRSYFGAKSGEKSQHKTHLKYTRVLSWIRWLEGQCVHGSHVLKSVCSWITRPKRQCIGPGLKLTVFKRMHDQSTTPQALFGHQKCGPGTIYSQYASKHTIGLSYLFVCPLQCLYVLPYWMCYVEHKWCSF